MMARLIYFVCALAFVLWVAAGLVMVSLFLDEIQAGHLWGAVKVFVIGNVVLALPYWVAKRLEILGKARSAKPGP